MRRPRLLVTLEGYAVEGGYDEPGSVMTCYSPVVALGRLAGPGPGDDLWRRYEEVLDLVPTLGVDGVRLSLEWARLEPRNGEIDESAFARYRDVLRHARELSLEVTAVLVDAVWPSWLGQEAWLLPWVAPRVLSHARRVVEQLGEYFGGLLAFTQRERFVTAGYLQGSGPPWREGALAEARFVNAQLDGIERSLAGDALVGPRLVHSFATTDLTGGAPELRRARGADVDELYLRSLLRGRGPTAVAEGLLVQEHDTWRVHADEELLDALR